MIMMPTSLSVLQFSIDGDAPHSSTSLIKPQWKIRLYAHPY
jgi:hypothetical protein